MAYSQLAVQNPDLRPVRRNRRRNRRGQLTFLWVMLACIAAIALLTQTLYSLCRTRSAEVMEAANEAGVAASAFATEETTQNQKLKTILEQEADYPQALRELAVKNPETIDYVYQYPALHDAVQTVDLSGEAASDTVPLLLQWDTRWGYQSYGSGLLGYTGCGPTCLSMVALYLTGDATATPAAVAAYAQQNDYYVSGAGTAWSLMTEGCNYYNVSAREISLSESRMRAALEQGQPIICAMGPGDFTDAGHFIVITGYSDGGFTVNDPNSPRRSQQLWSFDRLSGQIRNLWAFSLM